MGCCTEAPERDPMEGSGLRARPRRVRQEIVRFGRTRGEAEASLEAAVASLFRGADAVINPAMRYSRRGSTG
jgi:hypothetical protein